MKTIQKTQNRKNWFIDKIFNYNQIELEQYLDNIILFNSNNTEMGLLDELFIEQTISQNLDGYIESQVIYANLITKCLDEEMYELIPKLKSIQKYEFDNFNLILKEKNIQSTENYKIIEVISKKICLEKIPNYLSEQIGDELVNYIKNNSNI